MRYARPLLGAILTLAACSTDPAIKPTTSDKATGGGAGGADTSNTTGTGGATGGATGGTGGGFTVRIPDAGTGTGTTSNTPDGGVRGGGMCGMEDFKLDRLPPELLIVLDRSGSMTTKVPPTAGATRWTEVTAALDETVMKTEAGVLWGLKMFPSVDGCMVSAPAEVDIAVNNYAAVGGKIKMSAPAMGGGGTPTTLAMNSALAYMQTRTASKNPKYLLLATDGEPNCGAGGARTADNAGAVGAVKAAFTAGFHTFVVGIATAGTGANTVLNDMATAGGEPRQGDPKYYAIANRQDLVMALAQITSAVSTCVFPLAKVPPSPDDVAVNVDGKRVPRDKAQMDGWNYGADMKSIQLYGPWCEGLKMNAGDVKIIFGCPGVIIP